MTKQWELKRSHRSHSPPARSVVTASSVIIHEVITQHHDESVYSLTKALAWRTKYLQRRSRMFLTNESGRRIPVVSPTRCFNRSFFFSLEVVPPSSKFVKVVFRIERFDLPVTREYSDASLKGFLNDELMVGLSTIGISLARAFSSRWNEFRSPCRRNDCFSLTFVIKILF